MVEMYTKLGEGGTRMAADAYDCLSIPVTCLLFCVVTSYKDY